MRDCQHPSWNPLSNGKVACALCGAVGSELRYIKLDDPQLDLEDTFTRMFVLAEHWKNEAMKARSEREALFSQSAEDNSISAEPVAWSPVSSRGLLRGIREGVPTDEDLAFVEADGDTIRYFYAHPPRPALSEERVREIASNQTMMITDMIILALREAGVSVEE